MNDLISRQAVLNKKELVELEDGQSFYCISPEDVETLPPVTPQPKTGHWIYTGYVCQTDEIIYGYGCSECGGLSFFRKFDNKILGGKWCHCCGARMIEPQESEVKE